MSNYKSQIKIRDAVYEEIAARYVERYGSVLQRELFELGSPTYDGAYETDDYNQAGGQDDDSSGGWVEVGTDADAGAETEVETGAFAKRSADEGVGAGINSETDDSGEAPAWVNAATDEWIENGLALERRKKTIGRLGMIAAIAICLAIIFISSGAVSWLEAFWHSGIGAGTNRANQNVAGVTMLTSENETGAVDTQPSEQSSTTTQADIEVMQDADGGGIIPLEFPIRPGYSVVSVIQDAGRTIYFVANEKQDNIVMALRRGSISQSAAARLTSLALDDTLAYLSYDEDYSLLLFEKSGIVYELTCRYDINTLVDFCGFSDHKLARGTLNPPIGSGGLKNIQDINYSYIPLSSGAGSYLDIMRRINNGENPPIGSVVTEEVLNFFPPERDIASFVQPADESGESEGAQPGDGEAADGAAGDGGDASGEASGDANGDDLSESSIGGAEPFAVYYEIGPSPFHTGRAIAYVHIMASDYNWNDPLPSNITILIDTSSSMYSFDKLPLVKDAILQMAGKMDDRDRISILTYDGESEVLLDNAAGDDIASIKSALDSMASGVYPYYGEGLKAAYSIADKNFISGGANIVIAITDTDDNFGMQDADEMEALISRQRAEGVDLYALAVGALTAPDDDAQQGISGYGQWEYVYADSLTALRQALLNVLTSDSYLVALIKREGDPGEEIGALIEFNPVNITSFNLIGYKNRNPNVDERIYTVQDMDHVYAEDEIILLYEFTTINPIDFTGEGAGTGASAGADAEAGAGAQDAGDAGGAENAENADTNNEAGDGREIDEKFEEEFFELRIHYIAAGEFSVKHFKKAATYGDILSENSADFFLACSIAAFCGVLSGDRDLNASMSMAETLAEAGLGENQGNYRSDYISLLHKYRAMTN